jgi:hypothetical protein
MKLFHVIATSVLGAAMALGAGFALANKQSARQTNAESGSIVFDDLATATGYNKGTENNLTATSSGVTLTFDSISGKDGEKVQVVKGTNVTSTAFPGNVVSFTVFGCSHGSSSNNDGGFTVYGSNDGTNWSSSLFSKLDMAKDHGDQFVDLSETDGYCYIKLTISANRVLKFNKITFNYATSTQTITALSVGGTMQNKTYSIGDSWDSTGLTKNITTSDGNPYTGTSSFIFTPASPEAMGTTNNGTLSVKLKAGETMSDPVNITNIVVKPAKGTDPSNPYTVSEAWDAVKALGGSGSNTKYTTDTYYVTGTIVGDVSYNSTHNSSTFDITDGDKTIKAYSIAKAVVTQEHEADEYYVAAGYTVVVGGVLIDFKGTYEVGYNNTVANTTVIVSSEAPAPKEITGIVLTAGTVKTSYFDGDTILTSGLVATASYTAYEDEVVTGFCEFSANPSTASLGLTKVTFSAVYTLDNTIDIDPIEVTVTVAAVEISNINKSSGSYKQTFSEHELFSLGNAQFKAIYNNGSELSLVRGTTEGFTVSLGDLDVTNLDYYMEMSDAGKAVTLAYQGKTLEYEITSVTAESSGGEGYYQKVTNASDLAINDKIIIVNESANVAMSTTQNTNNRGQTSVTITSSKINTVSSSVEVFTLVAGKKDNTYALKTSAATATYICAASSSSNHLKSQTTLDDEGSWTISFSSGDAVITAQGTNTRNIIRYNSSSSIFSCYASGQSAVQIYEFVSQAKSDDQIAVEKFCDDYMHLDDISVNDHSGGTACIAYFAEAKAAYLELATNSARKNIFATSEEWKIARSRERLIAWANANNEVFDPTAGTFTPVVQSSVAYSNAVAKNTTTIIIVVASIASISLAGFFLVLRKRKEQ